MSLKWCIWLSKCRIGPYHILHGTKCTHIHEMYQSVGIKLCLYITQHFVKTQSLLIVLGQLHKMPSCCKYQGAIYIPTSRIFQEQLKLFLAQLC